MLKDVIIPITYNIKMSSSSSSSLADAMFDLLISVMPTDLKTHISNLPKSDAQTIINKALTEAKSNIESKQPEYKVPFKFEVPDLSKPKDEFKIPVNRYNTELVYIVEADVPGVSKDEIKVTISAKRELIIKYQRNPIFSILPSDAIEIKYGKFSRATVLPTDANVKSITSELINGLLRLTIGKIPVEDPITIEIA